METVILGKTGRSVSRIGFGGAPAGIENYLNTYSASDQKARQDFVDAIHFAWEQGITYFDTAPAYGGGVSERIFGEGLNGVDPKDVFLATKVSFGDAAYTRRSIEQSLVNLKREKLDLVQLHGTIYSKEEFDSIMAPGGQLSELEKAKAQGLITDIGFTVECQNEALYGFLKSGKFATMQVEYNLLFQHPYDPNWKCGSMWDAEARGMGILTMRTLTSGIFQQWMRHIRPEDDYDYNPALLQFVLSNPLVDVCLVGMRNTDEVKRNLEILADMEHRISMTEIHNWYK